MVEKSDIGHALQPRWEPQQAPWKPRHRLLPEIMGRLVFDPQLTKPDALVLENLAADIRAETTEKPVEAQGLAKRVANGHASKQGESPVNGTGMYSYFLPNPP